MGQYIRLRYSGILYGTPNKLCFLVGKKGCHNAACPNGRCLSQGIRTASPVYCSNQQTKKATPNTDPCLCRKTPGGWILKRCFQALKSAETPPSSRALGSAVRTTRRSTTARRIRRRPGVYFSFVQAKYFLIFSGAGDKPKHTDEAKMERKKEFEPWNFEANSIGSKLSRTVVHKGRKTNLRNKGSKK